MSGKRYRKILFIVVMAVLFFGCVQKYKRMEPDVVSCMKINRDETLTVVANRSKIEDKIKFAKLLVDMCKENSFGSIKFRTDYGYATSLELRIYLDEQEIESHKPAMNVEYKPVKWGEGYDIVNNPDMFRLYVDGKRVEDI